jgi:hypothetical protein
MYVFFILGKVMQNCNIYLMSCERIYIGFCNRCDLSHNSGNMKSVIRFSI